MNLPVSSEDSLHFYRYLRSHVLIFKGEFLLLIDIPIQDQSQSIRIYEVINLPLPNGNITAKYHLDRRYLGITYDETKAIPLTDRQFETCKAENGQFCVLDTAQQSLSNPPSCLTALYTQQSDKVHELCSIAFTKTPRSFEPVNLAPGVWIVISSPTAPPEKMTLICPDKPPQLLRLDTPLHVLKTPPACSATSTFYQIPPKYQNHSLTVRFSMDIAKLQTFNMTIPDFRLWKHLPRSNLNTSKLERLTELPPVPVSGLYESLMTQPIPRLSKEDSKGPFDDWKAITGLVLGIVGLLTLIGIGLYCLKFRIIPARRCRSLPRTPAKRDIVDEDIEIKTFYSGKRSPLGPPMVVRRSEIHGLFPPGDVQGSESEL